MHDSSGFVTRGTLQDWPSEFWGEGAKEGDTPKRIAQQVVRNSVVIRLFIKDSQALQDILPCRYLEISGQHGRQAVQNCRTLSQVYCGDKIWCAAARRCTLSTASASTAGTRTWTRPRSSTRPLWCTLPAARCAPATTQRSWVNAPQNSCAAMRRRSCVSMMKSPRGTYEEPASEAGFTRVLTGTLERSGAA